MTDKFLITPYFWNFVDLLGTQLYWLVPLLIAILMVESLFDGISTKMALKKAKFGVKELNPIWNWFIKWCSTHKVFGKVRPDFWIYVRMVAQLPTCIIVAYSYYILNVGVGTVFVFYLLAGLVLVVIVNNYKNAWRWPYGKKPY